MNNIPSFLKIKTLNIKYLDQIHNLLNHHYKEDKYQTIRHIYSKDYLYWHLKMVYKNLFIGLVYQKKLVGMVSVIVHDYNINSKNTKMAIIEFLCVQKNIIGTEKYLLDEVKNRINQMGIKYIINNYNRGQKIITVNDYVIPINCQKLRNINFLLEEYPEKIPTINYLSLMKKSDLNYVIPKLNQFMKKFTFYPLFDANSGYNFLVPKKNIIYSFVKHNGYQVTDFVSVRKYYYYCQEKHTMITTAQLTYYYHETMTLTELITQLINKLKYYKFDQLIFRNWSDNNKINITRFEAHDKIDYYLDGIRPNFLTNLLNTNVGCLL